MSTPQKKYQNSPKGRATRRAYVVANRERANELRQARRKKYPSQEKEATRAYYEKHPEKKERKNFRSRILLSGLDLSFEQYTVMLKKQKGVCAICGKQGARALAIDHDHTTGKIRGLLCGKCNTGIGMLGDTFETVRRAAAYLKKSL